MIACGRGPEAHRALCSFCHVRPHTKLCDYGFGGGRTCDRKMCDGCSTEVGQDKDHCPTHNRVMLEATR